MEKLNPTKHHKTSEEYAQLGLWKHYSSEEVKEQRDNMRESWADIMERRWIEKIVI
jgi:hypothetical protein